MKIRRMQVYITLVLIAFGFLLTFSYKNTAKYRSVISDSEWEKKQAIQEKILAEQEKKQELEQRLVTIKEQVTAVEKETAKWQEQESVLDELEQLRMWLGLVPVTGRGIIVTLEDGRNIPEKDTNQYIVREEQIRQVVNELFSAGAEAISINDQRLSANSAIIYSGLDMLVNGTKIEAPYTISAIGDPNTLKTALEMAGGVVRTITESSEIEIKIQTKTKLDLPPYRGNRAESALIQNKEIKEER